MDILLYHKTSTITRICCQFENRCLPCLQPPAPSLPSLPFIVCFVQLVNIKGPSPKWVYQSYGLSVLHVVSWCLTFLQSFMKLSVRVLKIQSKYKYMTEITIYNIHRAMLSKVCEPELWFICSACHLIVVNISLKFHEIIWNRFSANRCMTEITIYNVQMAVTARVGKHELWFLCFKCGLIKK